MRVVEPTAGRQPTQHSRLAWCARDLCKCANHEGTLDLLAKDQNFETGGLFERTFHNSPTFLALCASAKAQHNATALLRVHMWLIFQSLSSRNWRCSRVQAVGLPTLTQFLMLKNEACPPRLGHTPLA